jgi:hypothetical protein
MADVCDAIVFGNHRGANERRNVLVELVDKNDVKFGYALPLSQHVHVVKKTLPGSDEHHGPKFNDMVNRPAKMKDRC